MLQTRLRKLHLKESKMLLEELLKCQAAYERTVFMPSPCSNSFHIPQDYNFFKLH